MEGEKQQSENKEDSLTELNAGNGEVEDIEASEEENPAFYDRTNSFFDRISCEALEKQDGCASMVSVWREYYVP